MKQVHLDSRDDDADSQSRSVLMSDLDHVQDKSKIRELFTSIQFGGELPQHQIQLQQHRRCQSACPGMGYRDVLKSYETSYRRDFEYKTCGETKAVRPMTWATLAKTVPDNKPLGPTTYTLEYDRKFGRPASPERGGSSSGNRNSKPHPLQTFMVWRFPSKMTESANSNKMMMTENMNSDKVVQLSHRLYRSVYQNDYLGVSQGFQVTSAFNLPSNWRDNVPYGRHSSQRESYQRPNQHGELAVSTTRYGSNGRKHIPAVTVVPTANKHQLGLDGRTTYDIHYNQNAGHWLQTPEPWNTRRHIKPKTSSAPTTVHRSQLK